MVGKVQGRTVVLDFIDGLVQAATGALLEREVVEVRAGFLGEFILGEDVGQGGKLGMGVTVGELPLSVT